MIRLLDICLRLSIWFLLTSDFSLANIILGLTIALLLPRTFKSSLRTSVAFREWLRTLWNVILAIPTAYFEALDIMIHPHDQEDMIRERVRQHRSTGLIFLDIFLITLTPKTIVLKYHKEGWYEVHRIKPRKKP